MRRTGIWPSFACLLLTGCHFQRISLHPVFPPIRVAAPRAPIKVALLQNPTEQVETLLHWGGCTATTEVRLRPDLYNWVLEVLQRVFSEVRPITQESQAGQADYLVVLRSHASAVPITIMQAADGRPINDGFSYSLLFRDPRGPPSFSQSDLVAEIKSELKMPDWHICNEKLQEAFDKFFAEKFMNLERRLWDSPLILEYPARKQKALAAELEGDRTLESGDVSRAFAHYGVALKATYYNEGLDDRVREKYLKLVSDMKSLPAVPEEAERRMVRAQTMLRQADSFGNMHAAVAEAQRALETAPWWAQGYFNLSVLQEAAGIKAAAAQSLRRYLLAAPEASDAEEVRRRIYALEAAK
ncbi:MAG: hypothetical protein HY551_07960 [Elusimicrobia bacterium]|nr:hypothetical protein [Elusimicrobiota bacterium]